MSNMPLARELLLELAKDLPPAHAEAVRLIVGAFLHREPEIRRAPVRSKTVTPALKAQIKTYARMYPETSIAEIAGHFIINPGRVSEVLNGKR